MHHRHHIKAPCPPGSDRTRQRARHHTSLQLQHIRSLAARLNLRVQPGPLATYRIISPDGLSVLYQPAGKKGPAKIENTGWLFTGLTVRQVLRLTTEPLPHKFLEERHPNRARRYKKLLFQHAETVPCHWCHMPLNQETATIDHLVPLARGGVDKRANMVPACRSCNEARGCSMPERDHHLRAARSA